MAEFENEETIKDTVQDVQMLIRNSMERHKKESKTAHAAIQKKKKTIELYKEKVAKLIVEKEALESKKEDQKSRNDEEEDIEIKRLQQQIVDEVREKDDYDQKIVQLKKLGLKIKENMGGLNATKQKQDNYEKHIKSLESRLDKANQKFNESIEYDKKLRAEIDKYRKERFFFENIYKKLEKELEKVRNDISESLKKAYQNYEARDANQEIFESVKAQMLKTESEYVNILQDISNKQNIIDSRKKSIEKKEAQTTKNDEISSINMKNYSKSKKMENADMNRDKMEEEYKNLKYKFEKLAEFTGYKELADISTSDNSGVQSFCDKFIEDGKKNFELFKTISRLSSKSKLLETDIKNMENEIEVFKKVKNSQKGLEKTHLISELKTKTQKLIQQEDKYQGEFKEFSDNFKSIKNHIVALYDTLQCEELATESEKMDYEKGITEENALDILSKVEFKLKVYSKILEFEKKNLPTDTFNNFFKKRKEENKKKDKPRQDEYEIMFRDPKELNEYLKNMDAAIEENKGVITELKNGKTDELKETNFIKESEKFKVTVLKQLYDKFIKEKYPDKKVEKKTNKKLGGMAVTH